MDACANGAGDETEYQRRGTNAQNSVRSQAPVEASLEHLVQRPIADAALQSDRIASRDRLAVWAGGGRPGTTERWKMKVLLFQMQCGLSSPGIAPFRPRSHASISVERAIVLPPKMRLSEPR
jgi:hypothetical protein